MLLDADIYSLPLEPHAAFVRLVRLLDEKLAEVEPNYWIVAAKEYVQVICGFVDERELSIPITNTYPSGSEFSEWFDNFQGQVRYYQTRFRFRLQAENIKVATTIKISTQLKSDIHDLLNRIRKAVGSLDISEAKRDKILQRIADLQAEIDKTKTRLEAVLGLILEVSDAAGQAAEKLDPVVKLMERLKGLFFQAKSEDEQLLLTSKRQEPRLLQGPKVGDLDSEIPF